MAPRDDDTPKTDTPKGPYWDQNKYLYEITRKQRDYMMSRPPARWSAKLDIYNQDIFPISRAALKAKSSPRIDMLAKPRISPKKPEQFPKKTPFDEPEKLTTPDRIKYMSIPKIGILKENKEYFGPLLGQQYVNRMNKFLEVAKNTIYVLTTIKPSKEGAKKKKRRSRSPSRGRKKKGKVERSISRTVKEDLEKEKQIRFEKLTQPKKDFASLVYDRGPPVPLSKLADRLRELAKPRNYSKFRPFIGVRPGALTYESSDRVKELGLPKRDYSLPPKFMGVSKAAMKYNPSKRLLELSGPRPRAKMVDPDLRDNAFQISPKALKAICSNRTKELAQPKQYS